MTLYVGLKLAIFIQLLVSICGNELLLPYVLKDRSQLEDGTELAVLFQALAKKYTARCLKVVVGDPLVSKDSMNLPLVLLQYSGNKSGQAADFINKYSDKMTRHDCVTYLMTQPAAKDLMAEMTDPNEKALSRFFIVRLPSQQTAEEFLLDKGLANEEHVVAVVKTTINNAESWNIFRRQLLHPSGFPTILLVNQWSLENGFGKDDDIFPEQMANFYGKILKGVTLDFKPFTDYQEVEGSKVVIPKPSLDVYILNVIAQTLNFTYELVMPEDGLWGYLNEEGHWSGVVGDVEFRRADFSLVLSVTLERRRSVDFTRVYFIDPLSFVTAKNRPQPPWLKLITPFADKVWLLTAASIVAAMFLYYIFNIYEAMLNTIHTQLATAFMDILGSFLGQSLIILPRMSGGQILLAFWLLYGLLITTYYKTSLTAALAVPKVPPTIDNLAQLYDSDLNYGMINAKGSEYQMFSTSNVTLYKKLFNKMTFYSSDESMRRVAEGKYAYIYFKSNLESIVRTQFTSIYGETNLHVANEEFFPGGYGWAFPKGAPYRRTFDHLVLKCMQSGLVDKWLKDLFHIYLTENEQMKTPEEKAADQRASAAENNDGLVVLSLNHLQGAFLALFMGYGIGILILGIEFLVMKLFPVNYSSQSPVISISGGKSKGL